MNVFLGIATVPERQSYFADVMLAIRKHFDPFWIHWLDLSYEMDGEHEGVAKTKNKLLRRALDSQADWFFIGEDDVVIQDQKAVYGYLDAAVASGWEHLSFAHHGPANVAGPVDKDPTGTVEYYPAYVGAWCLYSRRSIETCGLLDEAFVNSWDHVEHTLRLSLAGFHPMPPARHALRAADATGSEDWLAEIPGSIENTTILHTHQWQVDRQRGRTYWRETYPESYDLVFGR